MVKAISRLINIPDHIRLRIIQVSSGSYGHLVELKTIKKGSMCFEKLVCLKRQLFQLLIFLCRQNWVTRVQGLLLEQVFVWYQASH